MSQYTLVLIETTGIQDYIFGSNHLAQNIGASELVARATSEWVVASLRELGVTTNATWDERKRLSLTEGSITHGLKSEVVYEGGGNVMLLFVHDDDARRFVQTLTRLVLQRAPGLELVAIRETFEWEIQALADVHPALREKLVKRKHHRSVSVPLVGLSVTAACVYTGRPAIGWDDDPDVVGRDAAEKAKHIDEPRKLISAEVAAKVRYENQAKDHLHSILDDQVQAQLRKERLEFVYDFGHFGDKGASSYIAVTHADGNGMGKRFEAIQRLHAAPEKNSEYVQELRAFSKSIRQAAHHALSATVEYLLKSLKPDNQGQQKFGGVVRIPVAERMYRSQRLLPFRPIVFGGDDVTFICDGRLGLALAQKYLQEFTSGVLSDGKPVYARAGVAIVKTHYPFARAYDLAAALEKSAKKGIERLRESGEDSVTVMDRHISTSGAILSLQDMRKREYQDGVLLMRPIRVSTSTSDEVWRTWANFTHLVDTFQTHPNWAGRRNKLKAFRSALRDGQDAISVFLENYRLGSLPEVPGQSDMTRQGVANGETAYFDPIEATDFFVALDNQERAAV